MIIRRPLVCEGCEKKTITRTRVGRDGIHHYSFPCPGCGVEIAFAVRIDGKSFSADHVEIRNARWTDSEDGAAKAIMFESEMPVPAGLPDLMSPWLNQAFNFRNLDEFARDEALRGHWIEHGWPMSVNLGVHFEKGNDALFDKAAGFGAGSYTRVDRLGRLGQATERAFNFFTSDTPAQRSQIKQRITIASSKAPAQLDKLAQEFVKSGRMASLWKEIYNVRAEFVAVYRAIAPIIMVSYWHEKHQDLSRLVISVKRFDELRRLFVDCFETMCRLLVIAIAMEAVIDTGKLEVRAKKRSLTIWEFEALDNANKRDFLKKFLIADLFVPVMDTNLRNGIGHHSARYDPESDEIVFYRAKGNETLEQRLSYTAFCGLCRRLFSAFELAVIYFHDLHLRASGQM